MYWGKPRRSAYTKYAVFIIIIIYFYLLFIIIRWKGYDDDDDGGWYIGNRSWPEISLKTADNSHHTTITKKRRRRILTVVQYNKPLFSFQPSRYMEWNAFCALYELITSSSWSQSSSSLLCFCTSFTFHPSTWHFTFSLIYHQPKIGIELLCMLCIFYDMIFYWISCVVLTPILRDSKSNQFRIYGKIITKLGKCILHLHRSSKVNISFK